MRYLDHFARALDVLLKRQVRAVVHDGREAQSERLDDFIPAAVIEMYDHVGVRAFGHASRQLIGASDAHMRDDRPTNLENYRGPRLLGSPDERLGRFLVVHVEGADRVSAL